MNSPISTPVLAMLALALVLAYCAGAFAAGLWSALLLIGSGIIAAVAVFMEASVAYNEGLDDDAEDIE